MTYHISMVNICYTFNGNLRQEVASYDTETATYRPALFFALNPRFVTEAGSGCSILDVFAFACGFA
jgi:hypothetical protein